MLSIEALPALTDNYIWLISNPHLQRCAVVDPGEAGPVLDWLAAHPGWQLSDILITHHHQDHVGGVALLKQHTGARIIGPSHETLSDCDTRLSDGDSLQILGHPWQLLEIPGHTLGHAAYWVHTDAHTAPWLFSGDTLFAGGCGRIFEGTAAQMFNSLQRLAALPANTEIYCAHEYTLSNLRFAQAVEPNNPEIAQRIQQVSQQRAQGLPSLPSTLETEWATNPFLRTNQETVRQAAIQRAAGNNLNQEAVFSVLREWKNSF